MMLSRCLSGVLPGFVLTVLFGAASLCEGTTRTVTNLNDSGSGSLRDTIAASIAGDTIVFGAGVTGVINLTNGELLIERDLTIIGPGAEALTMKARSNARVFRITTTTASLSGLTILGGNSGYNGGGISTSASLPLSRRVLSGNRRSGQVGGGACNSGSC